MAVQLVRGARRERGGPAAGDLARGVVGDVQEAQDAARGVVDAADERCEWLAAVQVLRRLPALAARERFAEAVTAYDRALEIELLLFFISSPLTVGHVSCRHN